MDNDKSQTAPLATREKAPPETQMDLAPVTAPSAAQSLLVIPKEWGLQIPIGDYRTSLDETTTAGQDTLFAFLNGDGIAPEDAVNVEKASYALSVMPIQKEVNGELLPLPRVAVHHDDGTFTDFRSPGILKSLGFIIKRYGQPPWRPSLLLTLERFPVGKTQDGAPKYMYRYAAARLVG